MKTTCDDVMKTTRDDVMTRHTLTTCDDVLKKIRLLRLSNLTSLIFTTVQNTTTATRLTDNDTTVDKEGSFFSPTSS